MTIAPHPPGGPDVDVLADLAARLLPPADDRAARGHTDTCAECSTILETLDRTGNQLRWLPPIPMPADVVSRIDAALAAETKIVSIDHLRSRRRRRQQVLGIAAAGAIVLGGAGVLMTQLGDGSSGADVSAGGDNDGEPAEPPNLAELDEDSLPDAVASLVTGGEGDSPLRLEGTAAPDDCVASVQLEGVDELIGVIEIRYGGRTRDAVFFTTSDPAVARVIVVDDCSLEDPEIDGIVQGEI